MNLFFDLDGVLARFSDGANALHNLPPVQPTTWNFHHPHGLTDEAFYGPMNREFWAGLGRWEDGFALLAACVARYGTAPIAFLTSPCRTAGCEEGKRAWVKEHLSPLGFDPWKDVFIGGDKSKLCAARGQVLLDDSDANVTAWHAKFGGGWLIPRPWNDYRHLCDDEGRFFVDDEADALFEYVEGLK